MLLDLSPEAARDELLAALPGITDRYGDLVAVAAAEWYEELRAAEAAGRFTAIAASPAPVAQVQGTARWAVGKFWEGTTLDAFGVLSGAVQRYVAFAGRSTIARNARLDPDKPRFARVPRGAHTCAWCMMLASRGWVYLSKETAGIAEGHYHDDCDCAIVPSWDADKEHIEGYDPDVMYEKYLAAREATGSKNPTQEQITEKLRRLYPDDFTDGVHEH